VEKAAAKSIVRFTWPGSVEEAKVQCPVGPAARGFRVKYKLCRADDSVTTYSCSNNHQRATIHSFSALD